MARSSFRQLSEAFCVAFGTVCVRAVRLAGRRHDWSERGRLARMLARALLQPALTVSKLLLCKMVLWLSGGSGGRGDVA